MTEWTKGGIYKQVDSLTSELASTNVAERIRDTARTGDSKKVENVFETFKKENLGLYQKIAAFGEEYNNLVAKNATAGEIFGQGEGMYHVDGINAAAFWVLAILGNFDEADFFDEWFRGESAKFIDALVVSGFEELAEFVNNESWRYQVSEVGKYANVYDLLVDIFTGVFKETSEE